MGAESQGRVGDMKNVVVFDVTVFDDPVNFSAVQNEDGART